LKSATAGDTTPVVDWFFDNNLKLIG
jgi:hypothetical protein